MKIRLSKSSDKILGALRVSEKVFNRLDEIAKKEGVSKQEIVRAILDEVIDKVEIGNPSRVYEELKVKK